MPVPRLSAPDAGGPALTPPPTAPSSAALCALLGDRVDDPVVALGPGREVLYANAAGAVRFGLDGDGRSGQVGTGDPRVDATVEEVLTRGGERFVEGRVGTFRVLALPGGGAVVIAVDASPAASAPQASPANAPASRPATDDELASGPARHAAILAAAARLVGRDVRPHALYANVARVAAEALGADGITVLLADEAVRTAEVAYADGSPSGEPAAAGAEFWDSVAGRVALTGTSHFCGDVGRARAAAPDDGWLAAEAGRSAGAIALLPLVVEGRTRGVLSVRFGATRTFTEDERYLLADFSLQVAIALHNALLFAAERREREQAEAAATIARLALGAVQIDEVAGPILEVVAAVVELPSLLLGVVVEHATAVRFSAGVGAMARFVGMTVPLEQTAARLALGRGEPVFVDDFRTIVHPELAHLAAAEGGLIVPLVAKGRVIGVLTVTHPVGAALTPARAGALVRLAASVALALDGLLLSAEERRQRERERTLATALAMMEQPVLITDPAGRVQYANPAAMREYGYAAEELATLVLDALAAPAAAVDPMTRERALAEEGVWTGETVHRRKDGTDFPAAVTLSAIRGDAGTRVGQVMTARNLSDAHRRADRLRQTEKMAALGELVAGVAHEVNNPLAGISAFAQLLLEEPLPGDQLESVRMIKREADRAVAVIRDLLIFARKSGKGDSLVDLNEVVTQTLRLRAYGFKAVGIESVTRLDPAVPLLRADEQKLQQVLLNLIVNAEHAMQHTPERRLTVTTRREGDAVVVEVADTGTGMAPAVQARIFEPFFTTKPEGSGTGLGLSVSYGIVQAHGGTLTCVSTLGAGTSFRLTLPISAAPSAPTPPTGVPA
ncbi:MAG TPA: ATP-binding protein [Gemmatimonadaceae bacterium]|nr:ATP-binding protein [Gemmatimonadaceae bacterium]